MRNGEAVLKRMSLPLMAVLAALGIGGCEKPLNYRFAGIDDSEAVICPPGAEVLPWPTTNEAPAFREDFDGWEREGYVNRRPRSEGEKEEEMVTATVMYVRDRPLYVDYGFGQMAYKLKDFAVNPVRGYVELQQLIFYECGQHDSDALLELGVLPSVSRIRFGLSKGGKTEDVSGLTLWRRTSKDQDFTLVGEYLPKDEPTEWISEGDIFEAEIEAEEVTLRFRPALKSGEDIPLNDGINRSVRLHFLEVYPKAH
ncbi:MAG: hypothetical protein LBB27_04255 [Tannerellaceae bacterium]|jgi:hypothetical protein|nr:hypothetical protein [Tannerellaceae bacterium]